MKKGIPGQEDQLWVCVVMKHCVFLVFLNSLDVGCLGPLLSVSHLKHDNILRMQKKSCRQLVAKVKAKVIRQWTNTCCLCSC